MEVLRVRPLRIGDLILTFGVQNIGAVKIVERLALFYMLPARANVHALDAATGEEILDLFTRLNRDGTTVVVVTHDDRLAAQAGRVIHMLDGRIDSEASLQTADQSTRYPAAPR